MSSWIGCIQQLLGHALKRGESETTPPINSLVPRTFWVMFLGGQGLKTKLSNYCAVAVITNIYHFTLSYTGTEVHMGDTCTKMLSQSVMTYKLLHVTSEIAVFCMQLG